MARGTKPGARRGPYRRFEEWVASRRAVQYLDTHPATETLLRRIHDGKLAAVSQTGYEWAVIVSHARKAE